MRVAIPGPLYHLKEAVGCGVVGMLIGVVGCALSGDFTKNARALAALSFGGVLMIAGGGAFVGLVVGTPANVLSRGAVISLIMAAAGYALVKALRRGANERGNVT